MSKKPSNPRAFPLYAEDARVIDARLCDINNEGMTLRDWFAGMVVQSLSDRLIPDIAAKLAYHYADAMLAERSQ